MKNFNYFLKGLVKSFKDNLSILIVLFVTTVVGIASITFCYRLAVFNIRQPESIDEYKDDVVFSYVSQSKTIKEEKEKLQELLSDNLVSIHFVSEESSLGDRYSFKLVYSDYSTQYISQEQYNNGDKVAVVPSLIQSECKDTILIFGEEYKIVGFSDNNDFYIPIKSINNVKARSVIMVKEQLSRNEISKVEKILNTKYNRDFQYLINSPKLEVMESLFMIVALIMLIVSCINVKKIFVLYLSKNNLRYTLLDITGMNKSRLCWTIVGESAVIVTICLTFSFFIDYFALRPMIKILGVEYKYDMFDILITYGIVFLTFVATIFYQVKKRYNSQAGDRNFNIKRG